LRREPYSNTLLPELLLLLLVPLLLDELELLPLLLLLLLEDLCGLRRRLRSLGEPVPCALESGL
jgi:hypothetical protein